MKKNQLVLEWNGMGMGMEKGIIKNLKSKRTTKNASNNIGQKNWGGRHINKNKAPQCFSCFKNLT